MHIFPCLVIFKITYAVNHSLKFHISYFTYIYVCVCVCVCVCFFKFTEICKTFYYFFYINVIKLCSLFYLYQLSCLLLATEAVTIELVRTVLVNLYIAELWVFFVGHGTTEAHFSACQPENPRCQKNWLAMNSGLCACSIKCNPHSL
jgi:hypothetical protein